MWPHLANSDFFVVGEERGCLVSGHNDSGQRSTGLGWPVGKGVSRGPAKFASAGTSLPKSSDHFSGNPEGARNHKTLKTFHCEDKAQILTVPVVSISHFELKLIVVDWYHCAGQHNIFSLTTSLPVEEHEFACLDSILSGPNSIRSAEVTPPGTSLVFPVSSQFDRCDHTPRSRVRQLPSTSEVFGLNLLRRSGRRNRYFSRRFAWHDVMMRFNRTDWLAHMFSLSR